MYVTFHVTTKDNTVFTTDNFGYGGWVRAGVVMGATATVATAATTAAWAPRPRGPRPIRTVP